MPFGSSLILFWDRERGGNSSALLWSPPHAADQSLQLVSIPGVVAPLFEQLDGSTLRQRASDAETALSRSPRYWTSCGGGATRRSRPKTSQPHRIKGDGDARPHVAHEDRDEEAHHAPYRSRREQQLEPQCKADVEADEAAAPHSLCAGVDSMGCGQSR